MNRILIAIALVLAACFGSAVSAGAVRSTPPAESASVVLWMIDVPGGLSTTAAGRFCTAAGLSPHLRLTTPDFELAGAADPAWGSGRVLDAGAPFTMLGVICDLPTGSAGVSVRLRTSADGHLWSQWFVTPIEVAAENGGEPLAFTEPLWTGAARYVQLGAVAESGGAALLSDVRLVALDPAADTAATTTGVAGTVSGQSLMSPRLEEHLASRTGSPPVDSVRPVIVSRHEWGADESLRGAKPDYAKVRMAFVHHTAGGNDYTADEAAAVVRGIYAYHTRALGWNDIGYSFLVDRFGTIYEGRAGGIRRGVVGAQVLGFNTGSCGVSVMGNYADNAPPAVALASLERLLAWKLKVHHLNPLGTATMRCTASGKFRAGTKVRFPVVAGHRQANSTECPGNIFYPLLPTVRLEAAGRPQAPVIALVQASAARFSPNGDGVLDAVALRLSLTKAAAWRIDVRDSAGKRVVSFEGEGAAGQATWQGTTSSGRSCPDGTYRAVVSASSRLGTAVAKRISLAIDTTAPVLRSIAVAPLSFSPNGDGWAETVNARFTPGEACATRVAIVDGEGRVARRLGDWRSRTADACAASWDGRLASGRIADEGTHRFLVECRDAAGNISRTKAAVALDCTVGFLIATPSTFSPNGDGVSDDVALAFQLTRAATVRLAVKVSGKTIRSMSLGSLGAGPHAVVWDGMTSAAGPVGSCRPSFTVTAASSLGTSSGTGKMVADVDPPTLTAPARIKGVVGKGTRLVCTALDAHSDKVEVSYTIVDAAGAPVAAASLGWMPTGEITWRWTPPASGVYVVTHFATDLGGNRQLTPAVTTLTVP